MRRWPNKTQSNTNVPTRSRPRNNPKLSPAFVEIFRSQSHLMRNRRRRDSMTWRLRPLDRLPNRRRGIFAADSKLLRGVSPVIKAWVFVDFLAQFLICRIVLFNGLGDGLQLLLLRLLLRYDYNTIQVCLKFPK